MYKMTIAFFVACASTTLIAFGAEPTDAPTYTDPNDVDADFAIQGEYRGEIPTEFGPEMWGIQVVALGQGKFMATGYRGGLPGDGGTKREETRAYGDRKRNVVELLAEDVATLVIADGKMKVFSPDGDEEYGTLKRVHRKSPTLGAKPPEGAIVLFDGNSLDYWDGNTSKTDDGLLTEGSTSTKKGRSYKAHVEFRLPYMPESRGQARGNSGFYVQGRYEIQMLDSFGLDGESNEGGGAYGAAPPNLNMCFPPLSWQTYDVDFTAPEFKNGKKIKNARLTVRHNGVVIHDDRELSSHTPGGVDEESADPGVLMFLQNHSNPVRYRNIWVVEQ